jgi:hypothetical protein
MLGRIAAATALIALAGCAGMESAGRSARSPDAVTSAPSPAAPAPTTAAPSEVSPPPQTAPAPSVSAPAQAQDQTGAAADEGEEQVIVPGVRERQVPPPGGDPRSTAERMEDIRAWDRCVMRVQGAAESDPLRPQLVTPEEYCRESLGMADRTAVPASRLERGR